MNITFTSTKGSIQIGRWVWPKKGYSVTTDMTTVRNLTEQDFSALKAGLSSGELSSDRSIDDIDVSGGVSTAEPLGREVRAVVDANGNVYLVAVGLGPILVQGETGPVAGVIDNLTQGGSTVALSAEQGKLLNQRKYELPSSGIPVGDLSAQVQQSLIKADNALITAPVSSVAGKTGTVVLNVTDVQGLGSAATQNTSAFATAAQGAKADTALQTAPVTSVAGRTGAITLQPEDIPGLFSQVATRDQGLKADTAVQQSTIGVPGGLSTLGLDGKVPKSQIPDISITDYLGRVSSQSEMLALYGQSGDWCIRSDVGKVYIVTGPDASQPTNWTSLEYPGGDVISVAGKTGAVTLTVSDVHGLGSAATLNASSLVKSVNGTTPDASGNVSVSGMGAVSSVAGKTGAVTLTASDVQGLGSAAIQSSSSFATSAQGALADSALQLAVADLRYIRTVNGQGPDVTGNVSVSGSGGTGSASFATLTGAPADNAPLATALNAKVDKAVVGGTVGVSGNMSSAHVGRVINVDTSSAPVVLTLVPGVISSASDRIAYKRSGGNPLSFSAANGATLNDPHLVQIVDGDLVVIAGTDVDTATVAGMPGDMVRKGRANTYTARQAIAPATLAISSGNVAIDASLSNNFTLTLTSNATLLNPTALVGGQAGTIDVINTGAFNLSYGTMWRPVVGATTAVKQGAGGFSIVTFKVSADGTKILFNVIQEQ